MRISKLMLPAVTVAGALALAGCGGGSSTTGAGVPDPDSSDTSTSTSTTAQDSTKFEALVEPKATFDSTTISTGAIGEDDEGKVGNVIITCTDSAGCRWRVANGQLLIAGTYTHKLDVPVTPTASTTGGGDWLSASNLIAGAAGGGANTNAFELEKDGVYLETPEVAHAAGSPGAEGATVINVRERGGLQTNLRLRHNRGPAAGTPAVSDLDYLVWGAWEVAPITTPGPDPERFVRATGSQPHKAPQNVTGSATYNGDVVGFHKAGTAAWAAWNGDSRLAANFTTGYIEGVIAEDVTDSDGTIATPIIASNVGSIKLSKIKITGQSLSGTATVTSAGTTSNAPGSASSGTWNVGFFGADESTLPTGVAGTFAANRPKKGTTVTAYEIQGAFGANN